MPKHDRATVRRVLEAALNKLDEEARGGKEGSNSILLPEADDATGPVILVIAESNSSAQNGTAHPSLIADQAGQSEMSHAPGYGEAQAIHPGLERFPLGVADPHPSAPKACFMEPGRACVSSGACEIRGF